MSELVLGEEGGEREGEEIFTYIIGTKMSCIIYMYFLLIKHSIVAYSMCS